jgi:hypothetical protein
VRFQVSPAEPVGRCAIAPGRGMKGGGSALLAAGFAVGRRSKSPITRGHERGGGSFRHPGPQEFFSGRPGPPDPTLTKPMVFDGVY